MMISKSTFILYCITICSSFNFYAQELKTKEVYDVKSFFEALDDNTKIIIATDTLNFTTSHVEKKIIIPKYTYQQITNTNNKTKKSYFIEESGVVLYGYNNLTIIGKSSVSKIISYEAFDDILTLRNCTNINLENIAIEHVDEVCTGMVLSLIFNKNVHIKNCYLNGSGAIGAYVVGCDTISFTDTHIFKNAFHAIVAINSKNILFTNTFIYHNNKIFNEEDLITTHFSELSFNNCELYDNDATNLYNKKKDLETFFSYLEEEEFVNYYATENLYSNFDIAPFIPLFKNCIFNENIFEYEQDTIKKDETIVPKKRIFATFFIKKLLHELVEESIGNYNGNFIIYELASFFSNKKVNFFDLKNKTKEDFVIAFHASKLFKNFNYYEFIDIEEINNSSFLITLKVKNNTIEELSKWFIKVNNNLKIECFELR